MQIGEILLGLCGICSIPWGPEIYSDWERAHLSQTLRCNFEIRPSQIRTRGHCLNERRKSQTGG
jgi:hypothetical protein